LVVELPSEVAAMGAPLAAIVLTTVCHAVTLAAPPTPLSDFNPSLVPRDSSPFRVPWTDGSAVPAGFVVVGGAGSFWITDGQPGGALHRLAVPLVTPLTRVMAARNGAGAMTITLSSPDLGSTIFGVAEASSVATLLVENSSATEPVPAGNRLVFAYDDGVHGRELWSTDGTRAGTALLRDLSPGSAETALSVLASNGAFAWLSVRVDGESARRLWITDGTAIGTHPLGAISPSALDADVTSAAVVGSGMVYSARDSGTPTARLYFASVSAAPSGPLSSAAGVLSMGSSGVVSTGTHAIFTATDIGAPTLFVTDGTGATALSESVLLSNTDVAVVPDAAAPLGWNAYFSGGATTNDTEPCRTDGTRAGTYQVADLRPGPTGSAPSLFTRVGSRVCFVTSIYNTFWITNGTPLGTTNLASLPGAPSTIRPIAPLGDAVICSARDTRGTELWRFDPGTSTFSLVADLSPGSASPSSPRTAIADLTAAIVAATTPSASQQAFVTDGTSAGTVAVFASGPDFGQPLGIFPATCLSMIAALDQTFSLFMDGASYGIEPWKIDRTTGAAVLLRDIRSPGGTNGSVVSDMAGASNCRGSFTSAVVPGGSSGGRAVFGAKPTPGGSADLAVWATDGTPETTVELSRHRSQPGASLLLNFTPLAGSAYFFAPPRDTESSVGLGTDLWVTNGTLAGTRRAASLGSLGMSVIGPTQLAAANQRLYFTGIVGGVGRLFASDGTDSGTHPTDLGPELADQSIGRIIPSSSGLFFVATDSELRTRLWLTDGSAGSGGTRAMTTNSHDSRYAAFDGFLAVGGRLYFSMWTRDTGRELWVTDGSAATTRLVADIEPGAASSNPRLLRSLDGGGVIFSASTLDRGRELWQSDGTAFGTRLIADLNPGSAGSNPDNAALLGPNLIFAADDGSPIGREFWTTPLTPACRCDIDNSGASSIQDALDYLSLYFTGNGDFNADGQTTVQDIFDFLNCWFTGCQ
jgi:ELWxxDGT repeat protein